MSEGRRLDRQRPSLCADRTASEARRPGSGSRAGGVSRAARGNDGSPNGVRRRRRLDAKHDSATGRAALAGDALTSMPEEHHTQDGPHAQSIEELPLLLELQLVSGRSGAAGSAAFEGTKHRAAGIARRAFPWRQAQRAAPQARRHRHRAQQRKRRVAREDDAPGCLRAINSPPATPSPQAAR